MKSAHAPPANKHFLCIGCIEERLGRRLTRRDFDLRRLINRLGGRLKFEVRTRRFRARLRAASLPRGLGPAFGRGRKKGAAA
jgi:hypothetical protein